MKVFEEISDVIPSDAHQMARCSKCFLLQGSKKGVLGEIDHTCWEIRVEVGKIHKIKSVSLAATKKR